MWGTFDGISSHFNLDYHRNIMFCPFRYVGPVIHDMQREESFPVLYKFAHSDTILLIATPCQTALYAVRTEND